MAYEHKDGSGSLFKNDKQGNDARPDYRGDVMVGGVLYEIAGWLKPKASNPAEKYMSLSVKPKQAKPVQAAPQAAPAVAMDDDSDIPF